MVAVPPDTIHVKRKRGTDDGTPVDFLRVERAKRSRSDDGRWVYQRKTADADPKRASEHAVRPASIGPPVIRPTRDGDEDRPLAHLRPAPAILSEDTASMRRFHLSRLDSPQLLGGVSKKRAIPAVFVERDAKKHRESLKAIMMGHNLHPTELAAPAADAQRTKPSPIPADANTDPASAAAPPPATPVKLKRPGRGARTTKHSPKRTPPPRVEDSEMDDLAREWDALAIEEIAKNRHLIEQQRTKSKYSPATSRFKPKAPKLRYHERHPEVTAAAAAARATDEAEATAEVAKDMEVDAVKHDKTDDEDDYVLETYERVPIERLQDKAVPAERIGLLVLDSAPDLDFFYGNESESSDEFPEDEEDENAEDYYAADYPDEDLQWDDEFDRNAYHYLNKNAADDEEFDERDFVDEVWDHCDKDHRDKDVGLDGLP
ncbi:hypothetical protein C8A05DRAFT_40827 [Staphylotrichum tortipilum]|uniref:Transcription factor Iwr1 domain-containing protein n=1 Tax=Staphylotrichum tortipilum TaxID=2831512 RepID=A0AAN6MTF2_9PEZI|nr:hypothetical protein C8A05DRAFT_40827 [Staphylotrichum longicolle]